jgi:NADH dehydrogenase [ubiquinone] 1 alpha subcomplex assembly factor 2
MSKLFARVAGYFRSRTLAGVDKTGNKYFTRKEEIDGVSKWDSISILYLIL